MASLCCTLFVLTFLYISSLCWRALPHTRARTYARTRRPPLPSPTSPGGLPTPVFVTPTQICIYDLRVLSPGRPAARRAQRRTAQGAERAAATAPAPALPAFLPSFWPPLFAAPFSFVLFLPLRLGRGRLARHCTRAARGRLGRHCTRARRRDANRTTDDDGDTTTRRTAGGTELDTAAFGVTARDARNPLGAP